MGGGRTSGEVRAWFSKERQTRPVLSFPSPSERSTDPFETHCGKVYKTDIHTVSLEDTEGERH